MCVCVCVCERERERERERDYSTYVRADNRGRREVGHSPAEIDKRGDGLRHVV